MGRSNLLTMPTTPAEHPSDDALELYSLGRLPPPEAAAIEEHLLVCAPCRERLQETDDYVAAMRQALAELGQERSRAPGTKNRFLGRWRSWKPVAGVAALAALVLLAVLLPRQHQPEAVTQLFLTAYRGNAAATAARAVAGAPISLHIDARALPAAPRYRVVIVDAGGRPVFSTRVAPVDGNLVVRTAAPPVPGQYWIRVWQPAGTAGGKRKLLREFGLRVT